jgi:hypothetical protein
MGWWGPGQETHTLETYPIISAHLHLFQGGFRQDHVIDPDSAFAVDDEVESDLFGTLPLLKQERCVFNVAMVSSSFSFINRLYPLTSALKMAASRWYCFLADGRIGKIWADSITGLHILTARQ